MAKDPKPKDPKPKDPKPKDPKPKDIIFRAAVNPVSPCGWACPSVFEPSVDESHEDGLHLRQTVSWRTSTTVAPQSLAVDLGLSQSVVGWITAAEPVEAQLIPSNTIWARVHQSAFTNRYTTHSEDADLVSAVLLVLAAQGGGPTSPRKALGELRVILDGTDALRAVERILGPLVG